MSLVPLKTHVTPTQSLFAAAGSGGGGGGGQNLTVSSIVFEGSTDPLEITLVANPNDGFSVRQGGATNPLAILTIDQDNGGQAEFGIRSLSTISGSPFPVGRFEQTLVPGTNLASLSYTLDATVSGNASTIGAIDFKPGVAGLSFGNVVISSESGVADVSIGAGDGKNVVAGPAQSALIPRRAGTNATNIYVPASGAVQAVAQFSTIASHAYELYIPQVRIQNEPAGAPAAGAWSDLSVDTSPQVTYLDTFDMASVSTVQNDLQMSRAYTFIASAAGHQLSASGSLSNTLSTAMTFGNGTVVLRDLGEVASMPVAINTP